MSYDLHRENLPGLVKVDISKVIAEAKQNLRQVKSKFRYTTTNSNSPVASNVPPVTIANFLISIPFPVGTPATIRITALGMRMFFNPLANANDFSDALRWVLYLPSSAGSQFINLYDKPPYVAAMAMPFGDGNYYYNDLDLITALDANGNLVLTVNVPSNGFSVPLAVGDTCQAWCWVKYEEYDESK